MFDRSHWLNASEAAAPLAIVTSSGNSPPGFSADSLVFSSSSMLSARARWVFYSAAVLAVADIAAISFYDETGPDAVAFVVVLAISAFAMWRTWKDQNTYV